MRRQQGGIILAVNRYGVGEKNMMAQYNHWLIKAGDPIHTQSNIHRKNWT